jgi:hypothetical protein
MIVWFDNCQMQIRYDERFVDLSRNRHPTIGGQVDSRNTIRMRGKRPDVQRASSARDWALYCCWSDSASIGATVKRPPNRSSSERTYLTKANYFSYRWADMIG